MPVSLSGPHGPASIQVVGGRVEQGLAVLVGQAGPAQFSGISPGCFSTTQ